MKYQAPTLMVIVRHDPDDPSSRTWKVELVSRQPNVLVQAGERQGLVNVDLLREARDACYVALTDQINAQLAEDETLQSHATEQEITQVQLRDEIWHVLCLLQDIGGRYELGENMVMACKALENVYGAI